MPAGPQARRSPSTIGRDRCDAEVFRVVPVSDGTHHVAALRFTDIQGLSDGGPVASATVTLPPSS